MASVSASSSHDTLRKPERAVNILVFGRDGQLSRAIRAAHCPINWRVTCLGRAEADITDAAQVANAVKRLVPDVIINTAAYTNVDEAEHNLAQAYAVNCDGAGNVARAAAERGIPVIHLSTDFVFSGDKGEAYVEGDSVDPINIYGASKEAGERAVRDILTAHVIVRTSWLYSAGARNFVTAIIRHLSQSESISVVEDQSGSPTYAADLASTLMAMCATLLQPHERHFGTFHAAGEGCVSRLEFAREIQMEMTKAVGAEWPGAMCRILPSQSAQQVSVAVRPNTSTLNCDKLHAVYGLLLPAWRDGLRQCIGEFIRHGDI